VHILGCVGNNVLILAHSYVNWADKDHGNEEADPDDAREEDLPVEVDSA